jgi:hypothetical protein|tara:strand:+ start:304 stop:729 length:426 start_codon:yes stop_codon:yes gene_type:complete
LKELNENEMRDHARRVPRRPLLSLIQPLIAGPTFFIACGLNGTLPSLVRALAPSPKPATPTTATTAAATIKEASARLFTARALHTPALPLATTSASHSAVAPAEVFSARIALPVAFTSVSVGQAFHGKTTPSPSPGGADCP